MTSANRLGDSISYTTSCWLSLISFSCLCFPSFPVLLLLLRWMPLHSTKSLIQRSYRRKSHQHQTLAHTHNFVYIYLPLLLWLLLSLDVSFVSWLVPPTFSRSFDFPSSFDFPFETIPPPADGWRSERLIFFSLFTFFGRPRRASDSFFSSSSYSTANNNSNNI